MICKICNGNRLLNTHGACDTCTQRAIEIAIEAANKCAWCENEPEHYFHQPASDCDGCKAPHDHHKYVRSGRQ